MGYTQWGALILELLQVIEVAQGYHSSFGLKQHSNEPLPPIEYNICIDITHKIIKRKNGK
jgi:hypothetical protein